MQAVLVAGFTMFCMVGVVALVCSFNYWLRERTALIVPIVLGLAAIIAAGGLWLTETGVGRSEIWSGWSLLGPVTRATGQYWIAIPVAVALVVLARLAFRLEGALAARRPKLNVELALPAELIAANLPGRAEAMDAVAKTARRPVGYWFISSWTVVGEELFFRVAAPATLILSGLPIWVAIVVPSAMYAANHIGFGFVSVIGKFLLGLVLTLGAWLSGALLAAVVHLIYQHWVRRQFSSYPGRVHRDYAAAP